MVSVARGFDHCLKLVCVNMAGNDLHESKCLVVDKIAQDLIPCVSSIS